VSHPTASLYVKHALFFKNTRFRPGTTYIQSETAFDCEVRFLFASFICHFWLSLPGITAHWVASHNWASHSYEYRRHALGVKASRRLCQIVRLNGDRDRMSVGSKCDAVQHSASSDSSRRGVCVHQNLCIGRRPLHSLIFFILSLLSPYRLLSQACA
jgi:hypothetical protein